MAFGEVADLAVRLTLDDKLTPRLGRAQSALGRFSTSVGKVGRGAGQLGTGLAKAATVGLAAVAGGVALVAKEAIDFQDAFQGVVKTVSQADLAASGLTFEQLAKQFRKLATEIPVAATELAAIGEEAGALGIKAKDITAFTEVVAKLGVTTDLTSQTAAEALGKVGTILGLTGKEFNDFADVLVNLGNNGASTESEIIEVTKRFAAMGKQAGLTTPQILALSSAATSLGAEPEAAGSALSRIFANMSTEIANSTKKGKTFAKVTGKSITELQRMVNKGQALPILLETLKGISGLSRTESASVLKALGITNVRDRNAILLMAQNLGFVNEQLDIAGKSSGALEKEATKRFDTIASKIGLIKNNLTEAALTIGEGLLPALGRAADKLIAFLKLPENHTALLKVGQDLGKALDDINWTEVLNGAKTFVGLLKDAGSVALTVLGTLNRLPPEVKALGLGLIGLNKLSGGLVGEGLKGIVGGLAGALTKSLAAAIPIFGKAFVQPVFVTNPGFGVGGSVGGAGQNNGIGSFLGAAGVAAIAGEVGLAVVNGFQSVGKEVGKGIFGQQFGDIADKLGAATKGLTALGGIQTLNDLPGILTRIPDEVGKLVDFLQGRRDFAGNPTAPKAAGPTRGPSTAAANAAIVANTDALHTLAAKLDADRTAKAPIPNIGLSPEDRDRLVAIQKSVDTERTAVTRAIADAKVAELAVTNAASARSEASAIRIAAAAATIANRQFETNAKLDAGQVRDLRAYTAQAASSARNEAAIVRLSTTTAATGAATRAAVVAAAAATQGVIKAGDSRSEAALSRLNATSGQLSGKMSRIGGSVAQIPGAIRAAKPVVNVTSRVTVNTSVSVRDQARQTSHVTRYGGVVIR